MNKNIDDIKGNDSRLSDPRAVDRASDDIRRGLIVCQKSNNTIILGAATELLTSDSLATIRAIPNSKQGLLLTDHRCEALKIHTKGQKAVFVELDETWEARDISALADPTLDLTNPMRGPFKAKHFSDFSEDFHGFLKLMKISRLLPSAFIAIKSDEGCKWANENNILSVEHSAINKYEDLKAHSLKIVAKAKVPLNGAEDTTIFSFRPSNGGPEHLAIIIEGKNKNNTPLVRLHSECFTGDLLGSLKCDCGDQLKGAIEKIAKEGGGIVLYLAQEGRGVGLTSKLKAYSLQDQGFDTVDANTRLGFEVDERYFAPAAQMLKTLKIENLRLLTNNPKKVEALKSFGINIIERVPHIFKNNPHNENYLQTKKDRTGHLL